MRPAGAPCLGGNSGRWLFEVGDRCIRLSAVAKRLVEDWVAKRKAGGEVIDIDDTITKIASGLGFNASHVTTFSSSRNTLSAQRRVTIEVHDGGSTADPRFRYYCIARADNGKGTSGNPAASVEVALAMVHWHKLD